MSLYGYRKFIVALYAQSSGLVALVYGLISGSEFVSITAAVLLLFSGANMLSKLPGAKAVEAK